MFIITRKNLSMPISSLLFISALIVVGVYRQDFFKMEKSADNLRKKINCGQASIFTLNDHICGESDLYNKSFNKCPVSGIFLDFSGNFSENIKLLKNQQQL